jgi:cysteine-rich repeat protein
MGTAMQRPAHRVKIFREEGRTLAPMMRHSPFFPSAVDLACASGAFFACAVGLACTSGNAHDISTETGSTATGAEPTATTSDTTEPDAPTTGMSAETSSTGSTTSFKPFCGDGVVAGDEICDDGNGEPEDGCDQCMPAPTVLWSKQFDGPAHQTDLARAVTFTPDGSLYVVGTQQDGDGLDDIVVRKLDPGGDLLWERLVDGPAGQSDHALAVAVEDDGSVVVAGQIAITADGATTSPWARRYTADGTELWTFSEDAPVPGSSSLWGVAIDGDAVYVVGREAIDATATKTVVRQLNGATGAETWQQDYTGGGLGPTAATSIVLAGGEMFVAGYQAVAAESTVATLQRWTPAGALVSTWSWSVPDWAYAYGSSAAVLSDGDIGLTVLVQTADYSTAASYLVLYSDDGTMQWEKPLAEAWESPVIVHAVTVDAEDRLAVVGYGTEPLSGRVGFFGVYAADGTETMFASMGGTETSLLLGIALHPSGLAVVGSRRNPDANVDQWIRKLAP